LIVRKPVYYFLPGIIFFFIIFILLCMPGSAFPKQNWLSTIHFDKMVHIGLFAMLVVLWCWPFSFLPFARTTAARSFVLITLLGIGYGIAMEFVQDNWIPRRSFELGDIIADTAGAVAGFLFARWKYLK
jgi:VanZ family protein